MRDADYYPLGAANDPNAPYNEVEMPEIEVECCVTYTLQRDSELMTNEVYYDEGWEVCEDADLWRAYEYDRMDIPTLLAELVKYIDGELQGDISRQRKAELMQMRESAIGWEIVERDIEI